MESLVHLAKSGHRQDHPRGAGCNGPVLYDILIICIKIYDFWAVKPGDPDTELGGAPRDAQGRVNPNRRFSDLKALVDHIHSQGLKAGIYSSPGSKLSTVPSSRRRERCHLVDPALRQS